MRTGNTILYGKFPWASERVPGVGMWVSAHTNSSRKFGGLEWTKRGGSVNRPDKSQSLCIICQWLLIAFLISGLKGQKVDLNTQENFLFLGVKPVSSGKDLILSKAVSSHLIGYPRDLKSLYKFWALASKSSLLEQMRKSLINWLYGRPRFKDMGRALVARKRLFFAVSFLYREDTSWPLITEMFVSKKIMSIVGVDRYAFFRADADTDYYRPSRPITDILNRYMSGVKMPSLVLVALLTLVFLHASIYNKGNIKRELKVGPL